MPCAHRVGILLLALCAVASAGAAEDSPLPAVIANNNRTPAEQFTNGVLTLHLELRPGRWHPEDEHSAYRDVFAFAEQGRAPQSPGPLIRVPQGTEIHATIRNALPATAKIYGLHRHPGDPNETLSVSPGDTREVQFLAGEPGTYLYWATTADHSLEARKAEETLLSGAFIVDSPGAKLDDGVFVLSLWLTESEEILSINGKSWPDTEHLSYHFGETTHCQVLNPTVSDHSIHLHGFYFTVDALPRKGRRGLAATDVHAGRSS